MIACDEILSVMDIAPARNVTKSCHSKKVGDFPYSFIKDHITIDN